MLLACCACLDGVLRPGVAVGLLAACVVGSAVSAGAVDPVLRGIPDRRRGSSARLPAAQPRGRGGVCARWWCWRRSSRTSSAPAEQGDVHHQPALVTRLQQVPVAFGSTRCIRARRRYGCWGGGAGAIVIVLLIIGADRRSCARRPGRSSPACAARPAGAGPRGPRRLHRPRADAGVAAVAIVIGAACTAAGRNFRSGARCRARGFLRLGGIKIESDASFQRPDWRASRGARDVHGTRAVAAFDGEFATGRCPSTCRDPVAGPGSARGTDSAPATITSSTSSVTAGRTLARCRTGCAGSASGRWTVTRSTGSRWRVVA